MIDLAPPDVRIAYTGFGVAPRSAADGDDVTAKPGVMYVSAITLPPDKNTISGIGVLNGSVVDGKVIGVLYGADGIPVLHTGLTKADGPDEFQVMGFDRPLFLPTAKPGTEWRGYVGLQATSPEYRFRSHQIGRCRSGTVDHPVTIMENGRLVVPPCYPPRIFTRYAAPWMMVL